MRLLTVFFLPLCFFLISTKTFSQNQSAPKVYSISTQPSGEFMLYQARQLRTKGIVAASLGSVLSGAGILVLSKYGSVDAATIGNSMAATANHEPHQVYAGILIWAGVASTITSIPLFIASRKAKRKAMLFFSDESTTLLHKKISVPSISAQFNF
jgi:hypothetical protein